MTRRAALLTAASTSTPVPATSTELAKVDLIRTADEPYREMSVEEQEAKREQFIKATPVGDYAREVRRHGLGRSQAVDADRKLTHL